MGWIEGDQRSWGVRGSCLELAKFNFANIDGVEFSKIIVSATAKNKLVIKKSQQYEHMKNETHSINVSKGLRHSLGM